MDGQGHGRVEIRTVAKQREKRVDPLAIADEPVALPAWEGENGNALEVIERDLRRLTRELAEVRFSVMEGEKQHQAQVRALLLGLLEALDAFNRVFRGIHAKADQVTPLMRRWVGNFRTVRRLVEEVLSQQGVTRIENLDQGFDPRWHKVAYTVFDLSRPEGMIVEEVKSGYVWQNQLLRKAEVGVVRHSEEEDERWMKGEAGLERGPLSESLREAGSREAGNDRGKE